MNDNLYLFFVIGIIINAVVLYIVIGSSTKTAKKVSQMEMQSRLLIQIAKKLGVEEAEIKKIIDKAR